MGDRVIHIKELRSGLPLFKALGSEVRVALLELLLEHGRLNMDEIAKRLGITNGAVTQHVRKLEECGLVVTETAGARHGLQKFCYINEQKILVELAPETEGRGRLRGRHPGGPLRLV